jgi:hypothetical protein
MTLTAKQILEMDPELLDLVLEAEDMDLPYPTTCFGCAGIITQADHDGDFTRYADGVEYHAGCMPEPTPDGEGYYLR